MLEFLLCAFFTILPDYLIKRYGFGRRWGQEITFFSMWYELRWGITLCIVLTLALITTIFYYHPSAINATPFYRTVTIMPEITGRVDEIYVTNSQIVQKGEPLFRLSDASQRAAVESARARVAEVDAQYATSTAQLAQAQGKVAAAQGEVDQALFDLRAVRDALKIDVDLVSTRQVEKVQNHVTEAQGKLDSAIAERDAVIAQLESVLPAQRSSATEALAQAITELDKTIVYAGVTGQLTQFVLQRGDVVNSMFRPAGILVPTESGPSGRKAVQAGFSQLSSLVVKPGTIAEISCLSKPFTVIPMVVTRVQPIIAAGQVVATDRLIDVRDHSRPGTITAVMEPLYENGMDGVMPGTTCMAVAYTNNHERLGSADLSSAQTLFYHVVDTVALVHAAGLRIRTIILPVQHLVFSSH
ncbi:MAG: biotin/lipoyl-binding protein [Gammaproteobacteria bacterium]|nr:biotin/lipoyl-binding protein [Gammaproteobacteria bacterium]